MMVKELREAWPSSLAIFNDLGVPQFESGQKYIGVYKPLKENDVIIKTNISFEVGKITLTSTRPTVFDHGIMDKRSAVFTESLSGAWHCTVSTASSEIVHKQVCRLPEGQSLESYIIKFPSYDVTAGNDDFRRAAKLCRLAEEKEWGPDDVLPGLLEDLSDTRRKGVAYVQPSSARERLKQGVEGIFFGLKQRAFNFIS